MKSITERMQIWACWAGCIFIILLISGSMQSYAVAPTSNGVSVEAETISIIVGESTIVRTPLPTIRVAVTDPKIADVKVLTPYQVLLQGTKVGSTDLIIWSEDEKEVWRWKIRVVMDLPAYKEKLDELFPSCLLEVSQSGEVLIVKGLLRSADQATQLHGFLDKAGVTYVDMTSIAGVQQVLLQVRFAEVSRTALRSLAVNSMYATGDFWGGITIGPSSGTPLLSEIVIGPGGASGTFSPAVTIFAGIPRADFEIFFKALAENQYLRLLADPTLVALSGEEASFLAGGEFPIPVPQGGAGAGNQTITIDYKEFGVRLLFRPTVLGDGTIRLYAAPEVSELSNVGSVSIGGFEVPALITRRAETTLELKSGQTFAMAGLIKHKNEAINSRIPGLGDLPVLGPLFRSVQYREDETELVVFVTASLVEPISVAAMPPLPGFLHVPPNDWELYLGGRIEGEEPAKINPTDAAWLKQAGLDNLIGPGAWESYNQPAPSSQAETAEQGSSEDIGK
jgi:pilus assembly protein CpaC